MASVSIFSDFLSAMAVPHSAAYSNKRFNELTFKSLFGLSRLLDEYKVRNSAWRVPKSDSIGLLPVPFLAQIPGNFVVVTGVTGSGVDYIHNGKQ
ncbi:MAG: hypothetical protein K2L80_00060, partial [Muribaculaceae bacterium]|nr:hypothetical protein [Muribaculaceae bacterium]